MALLPFRVLAAATATGAGAAVDLANVVDTFTAQYVTTGGPSGYAAKLQGSLDGATWVDLPSLNVTADGLVTNNATGVTRYAVRFIRANVTTLTGGTSPTVSVTVVPGRPL